MGVFWYESNYSNLDYIDRTGDKFDAPTFETLCILSMSIPLEFNQDDTVFRDDRKVGWNLNIQKRAKSVSSTAKKRVMFI